MERVGRKRRMSRAEESLSRGSRPDNPAQTIFDASTPVCLSICSGPPAPRSSATMASSLRLPVAHPLSAIRSGKGFSPFYPVASPPCQCRRFSQAPQLTGKPMATQNLSIPSPPQPSMRTRQKTMGRAEVPQDMGLLPGTFIRPMWSAMPSIFEQPRERLQMEWLWLRLSFGDFAGYVPCQDPLAVAQLKCC